MDAIIYKIGAVYTIKTSKGTKYRQRMYETEAQLLERASVGEGETVKLVHSFTTKGTNRVSEHEFYKNVAAAKALIGCWVLYRPCGKTDTVKGRIRGTMSDKRYNTVYLRIRLPNGVVQHKKYGSDNIIQIITK